MTAWLIKYPTIRVENNNKFVRGKTRTKQAIEDFRLRPYTREKPRKYRWESTLTIPYESDEQWEHTIYDILHSPGYPWVQNDKVRRSV